MLLSTLRPRGVRLSTIIHALLVNLPEFRALGINVLCDHVYGRINVLGDAASRGLFDVIHRVTRNLGVVAHQLLVPQRELDFLEEVRRQVLALHADVALHAAAIGGPVGAAPPAAVALPRAQFRSELDRMRHLGPRYLGPRYLNSESREFRFLFSAFALRSSSPLMGS